MKKFRYIEMAGIIRTQILSGFLKPGQFLLPEKELCQVYSISRNSLRQALDLLTNEGMLVKMVGRGTMVAKDLDIGQRDANILNIVCSFGTSFVSKALPILIEKFKVHYPNVQFRRFDTEMSSGDIVKDLSSLGIHADIVITGDSDMQRLDLDLFTPLEDIIPEQDLSQSKLMQAFSHNNQQYAVPLSYSPIFLACNPQLFAFHGLDLPQGGWNWDNFVEAAKQMTRDSNGDGLNDIYGFGFSTSIFRWPVLARKYSYSLKQDIDGNLNTEGLSEFLTFIQQLINKDGICPNMLMNDWAMLSQLFDEGRIGMLLSSTLATNMRNERLPVTIIPIPENPETDKGNLAIAVGLMIPKVSGNSNLAKQFAQFAISSEVQRHMASETKFLSIYSQVNRALWTEQELKALGLNEDNNNQFYFMNEVLPDPNIEELIAKEMGRFWAGFETPDEVIARLKHEFRRIRASARS